MAGQPAGLKSGMINLAGTPLEDVVESTETSEEGGLYLMTKPVASLEAYYGYSTLIKVMHSETIA